MSLRVSIEDVVASAAAVGALGEQMASAHNAADGRIDAALAGWQGRSAAALTAKAEQWAQDSRALLARLSEHAQALHTSAAELWAHERRGAHALDSV